jgi:hypothetical protein
LGEKELWKARFGRNHWMFQLKAGVGTALTDVHTYRVLYVVRYCSMVTAHCTRMDTVKGNRICTLCIPTFFFLGFLFRLLFFSFSLRSTGPLNVGNENEVRQGLKITPLRLSVPNNVEQCNDDITKRYRE